MLRKVHVHRDQLAIVQKMSKKINKYYNKLFYIDQLIKTDFYRKNRYLLKKGNNFLDIFKSKSKTFRSNGLILSPALLEPNPNCLKFWSTRKLQRFSKKGNCKIDVSFPRFDRPAARNLLQISGKTTHTVNPFDDAGGRNFIRAS